MRKNIKVSLAIKGGYSSILVTHKGRKVFSKVRKLNDNKRSGHLKEYLTLLSESLNYVNSLVTDGVTIPQEDILNYEMDIDIRSSTIIQWIDNFHSTTKEQELFYRVLDQLDEIPMIYTLQNNGAKLAQAIANEKYLDKDIVTTAKSALDMFSDM